ncbi:PREDICTED: uncharacterized protein LOC109466588 [Branchiostoma belcheri]|uniref:Uncharacterized protein LOC109466588 n=1 Tax=Branchiostoma belcheri TaxID=7741 RepID=A0A6P4Y609_BRABE|nr:PREDICTED: uncharacterized protein LOC109466588 [Branchiostoma belcheri]
MSSSPPEPGTVDTERDTVDGEGEAALVCGTVSTEAETVDNEAQPIPTDDTVDTPTLLLFRITCDNEKLLKFLPRGRIKKDRRDHVTIGRRETSDLRLNHPQASRDLVHITPTVDLSSNFSFTIQNVGSKGLSVNNTVLRKGEEKPLTTGSVIKLDLLNVEITLEIISGDDEKVYEVQFTHINQDRQAPANNHNRLAGQSQEQQPSSNSTSEDQNIPVCEKRCTDDSPEQNEHLCGKHVQPPLPQCPPVERPQCTCTARANSVPKQASVESVHELLKQVSLEASFGSGSATQVVLMGSNIVLNMGGQGSDTPPQGLPNTADSGNGEVTAMQESGEGGSQSAEEGNPIQETEEGGSGSQSVTSPEEGSPIQDTEEGDSSSSQPVMCTDEESKTNIQEVGNVESACPVEHDDRNAHVSKTSENVARSDNGHQTKDDGTVDTPTKLTLTIHSSNPGLNLQYPKTIIEKRSDKPFLIARHENSDILIDDKRVSREHMQIEAVSTQTGFGFQLRKLKKNKIVRVDGQPVNAEMPVKLKSGSRISLECLELPESPAVTVEFGVKVDPGDAADVYEVLVKKK